MKAMIFAAGLGTRLKPLTDSIPKALVEVHGKPMLEWTLRRLMSFRVSEVIINTHHFAGKIEQFVKTLPAYFPRVKLSYEENLLDTGGGLKNAAWFFEDDKTPFILHNSDVLSDIDLQAMMEQHGQRKADITLAVRRRKTSRYLLFDADGGLCGHQDTTKEKTTWVREKRRDDISPLSFAGIHVISPAILKELPPAGSYPILPQYLKLAGQGRRILAYNASDALWLDIGRPENMTSLDKYIPEEYFQKLTKKTTC